MIQNAWELSGSSLYQQERRAQAIVFYLNVKKCDLVLDIGCAEGFITSYLSDASFVVGLDRSRGSLLIAKKRVTQPNIDFILADATALPLRVSSFDKVIVPEVLEHLPKEKQGSLCREVEKVLKDNKVLIVTVPYEEHILYTYCIHCGKATPIWGHLCSFNEEKLVTLLSNCFSCDVCCFLPNVRLVSLSRIFQYLPFRIWLVLNNLLARINKGYWIILKCRKK